MTSFRPSWALLISLAAGACSQPLSPSQTEQPAATEAATATTAPAAAPSARATTTLPAPDCAHPFGLTTNSERIYRLSDAKGETLGELRQRVVSFGQESNKKGTVQTTTVLLKSGRYDAKNQLVHQQDLTYRCRRDTAFTDGLGELEFDNLRSFRDRYFTDAPTPVAWPHQPTAASELPAGGVKTDVRSSAVDIANVYTKLRNRRVGAAPASITVPAGTFSCYQVTAEREAGVQPKPDMIRRTTTRVVDYYHPSVGLIRSEVYDKNDKLQQVTELIRRAD